MIKVFPASSRFSADHGWLQSNFSFSFADYFDRNNMNFSVLRVFNDDIIAPGKGFGMHPHQDMEIVSIVNQGKLEHKDSMGNVASTSFGEIQRMSAGTGVYHSEFNPTSDQETHLFQLWFMPQEKGIKPSYEHTKFDIEKLKNNLLPVVSQKLASAGEIAYIHQDLTLYLSDLDAGEQISFSQEQGRNIYIFVIEGDLSIQGQGEKEILNNRDAARITNLHQIEVSSTEGARWMLIDLPQY